MLTARFLKLKSREVYVENNFLLFAGFFSSGSDFSSGFSESKKILNRNVMILGNSHIGVFYEDKDTAKKDAEELKNISGIQKIEILGGGERVFFFEREKLCSV